MVQSALSGSRMCLKGGIRMPKITMKAARVNVGLTQKQAATEMGVSNKTLCSWEKGESYPNAIQIKAICELYNVAYDNLIFLPNNPL